MTDEMIDSDKMRALEAEVSRLPRAIAPPTDAWTHIHAMIERESITSIHARPLQNQGIRFWQRPGFLAAAAAALIVGTATTTILTIRREPAPPAKVAAEPVRPAAALAHFASRENSYIATANRLEAILESSQSSLAPETVAKLKQSLAVIDAAILEARQALAADPANRDLLDMLSSSYDKKLDLLRRSTAMGRT